MTSSLALGVTVVIAVGFVLDRIAAARRSGNGKVRALNTRVETIPSALVASLGFTGAEYFLADEGELRTVPTVGQGAG
jgi:hypothetical protein